MNGLAVAALESWNLGPEILDADREQNPVGFDRHSVAKADREQLASLVRRSIDDAVHKVDAELRGLSSSKRAKLGRANALVPKVAVYATGFPIAGIAGIDDYDFMEVASEPERGT